jgi:DNA repair protein RadC
MEHAGHRKRLIQKLAGGALVEHEVLEALLFNAVPRKNTNDLAHRLLAEFGSVTAVLGAPISHLTQVDGVGESVAAYLRCVGAFCERYYAEYKERFPEMYDEKEFSNFVRQEYSYLEYEVLDAYLVEKSGRILQRRRISRGDRDSANIPPDVLTEILATRGVAGIVLVHNHPHAGSKPSQADEDLTKQTQMICSFHNLLFCDHIICGNDGAYSYYMQGKMSSISKNCSIRTLLAEGDYGEK